MCSQSVSQLNALECHWPLPRQAEQDDVIVFRSDGFQLPLFIIPDAGGEIFFGARLTSKVHHDIPVYGLRGQALDQPPFTTVQGAASRYVSLIRSVQPIGPYRLIGWAYGGVMAYEIACQLLGLDEQVEFVGMLDSWLNEPIMDSSKNEPEDKLSELSQKAHCMLLSLVGKAQSGSSESVHPWEYNFYAEQQLGLVPDEWSGCVYRNWLIQRECLLEAEYHAPVLPIYIDLLVVQDILQDTREDVAYHHWDRVLSRRKIRRSTIHRSSAQLFEHDGMKMVAQFISRIIENSSGIEMHPDSLRLFDYKPVVRLQQSSSPTATIICIPGAGDSIFRFMDLVDLIPSEWRVCGLQPRGFLEGSVPHSSVEAVAKFYLEALQLEASAKPVYLLGHSFGGWVAFEMAAQLEQRDCCIDALILADSDAPVTAKKERSELSALMSFIRLFEKQSQSLGLIEHELSMISHRERLIRLHYALIHQKLMPVGSRLKDLEQIFRLYSANIRTQYYPTFIPSVKTHLIVDHHNNELQKAGWQSVQPEINCTMSTGNHMTLLKQPHVQSLADLICDL